MNEYNSHNIYSNLSDQKFRLNKIEVRGYFIEEIKETELTLIWKRWGGGGGEYFTPVCFP